MSPLHQDQIGRYIGRDVIHQPTDGSPAKRGKITGFSPLRVFVTFAGDTRTTGVPADSLTLAPDHQ